MMWRELSKAGVWLTVVVAAGCASTPRPRHSQEVAERLAQAHVAVIEAERENGSDNPQALALRSSARRSYHQATRALEEGKMLEAQRALESAEADAELSLALARRERWEREASYMNREAKRLSQARRGGEGVR